MYVKYLFFRNCLFDRCLAHHYIRTVIFVLLCDLQNDLWIIYGFKIIMSFNLIQIELKSGSLMLKI